MTWAYVKLKDLCDITSSKRIYASEYVEEGVPFYRSKEVIEKFNGTQSLSSNLFISHNKYEELKDKFGVPRVGDILLTSVGTLGIPFLVKNDDRFYFKDGNLTWFKPLKSNLRSRYLYYWLQSDGGKRQLAKCTIGTSQSAYTIVRLKEMSIELPPLDTQNKIASILSAYDDLIENNNCRIALLEESARLLYREWFVRLRFPGHENTRITDGVPEGWEIVKLKDYINVIHGCAFKGAYFSDTETQLILLTPGNFKVGGGIKFDKLKFYSEAGPLDERYVLSKEDLLVTMTDLSKMSDTLGYPMLVPDHSKYTFLHNQRLGKVEPISTFFPKYFLYCLFQDYRYRNHVVGSASGVAVKHTSPTKILSFKVPLPEMRRGGLVDDFNNITQNSFLQIEMLIRMNHSLQKARDLLLPKLMNGEIPV